MKKAIIGFIILLICYSLAIAGIICMIIGNNLEEGSLITETILVCGYIGIGIGVGGMITLCGALLIGSWLAEI